MTEAAQDEARGLSRCWQGGWHAYMAGPCFETKEQAISRRDYLDKKGLTWESVNGPRWAR